MYSQTELKDRYPENMKQTWCWFHMETQLLGSSRDNNDTSLLGRYATYF